MKKIFMGILLLALCAVLAACKGSKTGDAARSKTCEIFQVGDYPIAVTTPSGWEKESDSGSFDLQCISPKLDMYLSVYGFSALDLSEEQTAQDLFELQADAVLSARDNVAEIEPVSMTEDNGKIIYSALYSAERAGVKNYYHFFFIHFKSTDNMAWILFSGMPSVIEKNQDTIDEIITAVTDRSSQTPL